MKKIHLKSDKKRITHPRTVCRAFMSTALKTGHITEVDCCKCQIAFIKAVIKKEAWTKRYKGEDIPWLALVTKQIRKYG